MREERSWAAAPVCGSAATWPSLAVSWLAACSEWDWDWVAWPSACSLLALVPGYCYVWEGTYLSRRAAGDSTHGALGEAGGRVHVGLEGGRVVRHCVCSCIK